jgi:hypothetical protein
VALAYGDVETLVRGDFCVCKLTKHVGWAYADGTATHFAEEPLLSSSVNATQGPGCCDQLPMLLHVAAIDDRRLLFGYNSDPSNLTVEVVARGAPPVESAISRAVLPFDSSVGSAQKAAVRASFGFGYVARADAVGQSLTVSVLALDCAP